MVNMMMMMMLCRNSHHVVVGVCMRTERRRDSPFFFPSPFNPHTDSLQGSRKPETNLWYFVNHLTSSCHHHHRKRGRECAHSWLFHCCLSLLLLSAKDRPTLNLMVVSPLHPSTSLAAIHRDWAAEMERTTTVKERGKTTFWSNSIAGISRFHVHEDHDDLMAPHLLLTDNNNKHFSSLYPPSYFSLPFGYGPS